MGFRAGEAFTFLFLAMGPNPIIPQFAALTAGRDRAFKLKLAFYGVAVAALGVVVAATTGVATLQAWGVSTAALALAIGTVLLILGLRAVLSVYGPHIEAAQTATRELNAPFLTVMLEGKYTDAYLNEAGKDAPKFTDEDLRIIGSPLDFVGINVYKPNAYVLASGQPPGYREIAYAKGHPAMFNKWLAFGPEAMYWAPKFVQSLWNAKEIFITENGCASDDVFVDGQIYDTDRIMYLRHYLTQLQRATADGVPVKGYFEWSAMDNFEWSAGYANRFGVVHVDFETQKRTPKQSAHWFREAARRNAVV